MTRARSHRPLLRILAGLALSLAPSVGHAQVVVANQAAFAGFVPVTFTGLPDNLEVNGLTSGGILFGYSLGNGLVVIDGGPGITNSVANPNIVSLGDNTGILSLILPGFVNMFGYGYAILNNVPVTAATTVTLFSGATNLGSLSFNGVPDPTFTGGFAGVQSFTAFDRVELTFSHDAPAFAIDNLVMGNAATTVPEPATTLLVGAGLAAVFGVTRRRAKAIRTA